MGQLFIIEGGDGSGKATQTALLVEHLRQDGYAVRSVSFPNYDSPAAMPIKMYLGGEFGHSPTDVNPYVASTFYAIDRFASFRKDWKDFYESGGIIVADRYTTSNMVHQMIKYDDHQEREAFLGWLEDLEYGKYELPQPTAVILLDVPQEVSDQLMMHRQHKTGGATGDIHENDAQHLRLVRQAYDELVNRYGWVRIDCATKEKTMKSIETIHEQIYKEVRHTLKDVTI